MGQEQEGSRGGDLPEEPPASKKKKKPYERPRILYRERLEAAATLCTPPGKGDPLSCPSGPISS
jgi:hypothetical protein